MSERPFDFFPNKTLSCTCVTIPVDWIILHWYACGADGRLGGRSVGRCTVTWLPNFLGWVVYHIFYPWCCTARASRATAPLLVHFVVLNGCILFNIGQYRYRYWFCCNLNITFADNITRKNCETHYYLFGLSRSYKRNVLWLVFIARSSVASVTQRYEYKLEFFGSKLKEKKHWSNKL